MAEDERPEDETITTEAFDAELTVRDAAKREIEARIVPWDMAVETPIGLEMFRRGAFSHVRASDVVLRLGHEGEPVGRGISLEERDDGAHMVFRVSKTARGDDALVLAEDGVTRHVSVEYSPQQSVGNVVNRGGRRLTELTRVALKGVATTYNPAYERAEILAVREEKGQGQMAENPEAALAATEPAAPAFDTSAIEKAFDKFAERMESRVERMEERSRSEITIPSVVSKPEIHSGEWMQVALKLLTGERVPELQTRTLADLITTDNAGVVPEAFSTELIGIIDARRPFLNSTRRIPTPDTGMTLNMPVLTTRPTVGVQANEKDELTSTETSITSTGFDAITIGGAGDISLQLLKRSSPSYLSLYLELLAEALAKNAESEAISALLASGVTPGTGTLDPEALVIGEAWSNGQAVGLPPDTIWLSPDAVALFIDAKNDGTNSPLYGALTSAISVAGGVGGPISGLRPVFVPALDGSGSDVVIGPSRGFAWAEDGAFTLQVDVPGRAGRDVALVVIDWFAPLYPAAFTEYSV